MANALRHRTNPRGVAETVGDGVVCRCRNTSVRDGRLELGSSLQRAMPGHRPPHCLHRRETGGSRDPRVASFKIIGAFAVCGREGLDRAPSVLAVVIDSRNDASSDLCRRIRQAGQAGGMTFTGLPLDEVLRTERQHQARGMKGRTPERLRYAKRSSVGGACGPTGSTMGWVVRFLGVSAVFGSGLRR